MTALSNKAQAKHILNDAKDISSKEAILTLVEDLKSEGKFSYAAMLLKKLQVKEPYNNELLLNLSLCVYKDNDLPSVVKYDKALDLLKMVTPKDNPKQTCQKYAQYGAIYKRMWQAEGNPQFLDTALYNYKKGYELWLFGIKDEQIPGDKVKFSTHSANDNAYNAINYAFCLDLLAEIKSNKETFDIIDNQDIERHRSEAQRIRNIIIQHYLGFSAASFNTESATNAIANWDSALEKNEWIYGTLGESFFGEKIYEGAGFFYSIFKEKMTTKGIEEDIEVRNDWKISITAQQLYSLATLQSAREKNVYSLQANAESLSVKRREVLNVLINNPANLGEMTISDKVGIGLSGGGFRAALYHIGVLARLAELDMLRNLEVISCVSGGSIIGTFYYLKVKKLLEEKIDAEIVREDYIRLVQEVETEFLAVVQKNIRQEVFTNIGANFKMGFHRHYSRTHRLGELYEEYFYAPLTNSKQFPVPINSLIIAPADSYDENGKAIPIANFKIKHDNWYRKNKVPILVLNATSLNTGHNWQFTAKWMGEPPANLQPEVDMKSRLRRMDYTDAPKAYQDFRLGYAVASSSCVPGLFAAFPMPDLYPKVDLKLVDGGVHDNQGISSLIEQECKFIIVSDASGQLAEENAILNSGPLYTINRTNLILQERIRENEFLEVTTRYRSSQLSNLKFMHLRKFLYSPPISCYGSDEPVHFLSTGVDVEANKPEDYGIKPEIQDLISKLRTDLDAFSDQEAFALMYSGYQMTKFEFLHGKNKQPDIESASWRFFVVADEMSVEKKSDGKFAKVLELGSLVFGKVLEISSTIKLGSYIFASAFILFFGIRFFIVNDLSLREIATYLLMISSVLALFFSNKIKQYFNLPRYLESILLAFFAGVVIGPLIIFYMFFFNKIYLEYGEVVKKWWKKPNE